MDDNDERVVPFLPVAVSRRSPLPAGVSQALLESKALETAMSTYRHLETIISSIERSLQKIETEIQYLPATSRRVAFALEHALLAHELSEGLETLKLERSKCIKLINKVRAAGRTSDR